ncbi:MAG: leucine-rich repeat domain-containing protein [Clostridia bacterium]|nr:leucine-rich repeat domain-containing protein [Clostridia bacterium]
MGNCLIDTETKTLVRGTNLSVTPSGEEITSIGAGAFDDCISMTAFGIPDTVTSIGNYAFYHTSLLSITIPAGVTEIGGNAFNNCESLNVIAVNSDSIRHIGPNAFQNCGYCNDSSNAVNGVFYISSRNVSYAIASLPDIEGEVTLKNNTGFIADYAFGFKSNITQAVLPSGLETIGEDAFYACSGLGSINIPASVTEIGSYAFDGCDSLSEAFYEGTREQWNAVNVSEYGNDALFNALRFADDSIEFRAVNFTLGGDIGFNLYFKIPDADEQTYTKFSYDGKTINAPINLDSEKNIDGGEEGIFYRFTCTVPAADVSKTISVTVVTGSGYKFAGEFSVNDCLEYLQYDSQYSNDADLMNLIGALADYGRYAHELFEPQEDFDSATIGSYQDSIDSVTAASAANNPLTLENNGGVKYAGMSLVLRTKTAIRFYFTLPKGNNIEDYSFTAAGPGLGDDGAALTPVQKGSRWYVEISDIPSAELGTNYTVSVYKGENAVNTWTGSAFSYVNQVLGAPEGTFGSALINVCKALYNYGKYAAVYFA